MFIEKLEINSLQYLVEQSQKALFLLAERAVGGAPLHLLATQRLLYSMTIPMTIHDRIKRLYLWRCCHHLFFPCFLVPLSLVIIILSLVWLNWLDVIWIGGEARRLL